ncbi:MAG: large conductance mechanosensitive channel protein MscL [Ruminococcaceae bacterium]|nr:large conductance mechanosensitive channel protein MscL [Oscillospiraceae bacterium]
MKKFFEDFKKFALRGNVLDMAVGIIIGTAFTAIVNSLTLTFIQPLLTAIFTWNWDPWVDGLGAHFAEFLAAIANFVLTAFILFVLLKFINALMELGKKKEAAAPTTKKCPYCKSDIPLDATRCAHCTSKLDQE